MTRKPTCSMRIYASTRDILRRLSDRENDTMIRIVEDAVEERERNETAQDRPGENPDAKRALQ